MIKILKKIHQNITRFILVIFSDIQYPKLSFFVEEYLKDLYDLASPNPNKLWIFN
ncbi:hypothetical protein [Mycoplasma anserisalpingitidis]|uniref:hypothetical protein n=1 Tax=Mycoplasma anserisalpingitidis TaxID=519450 RepID=UPI0013C3716D|nr:hypothetical protein [Mycoplasma anserisalpingitidis]UCU26865.1 hypothetical protein K7D06_00845 [Mycoplasma anserisalpingitidis]UCU27704.1 hypothetical protein K9O38_01515 [Mycoplasma anserisalpingitidis]